MIERKMSPLGAFVRCRRLELGYTQERLAAEAGVGRALIVSLETGRARVITWEQLKGLADGLRLVMSTLLAEQPRVWTSGRYIHLF